MNSTGMLSFSGECPSLDYFGNSLVSSRHLGDSRLVNLRPTCLFSFSDSSGPITEHTDFVPEFIVFNEVEVIHN